MAVLHLSEDAVYNRNKTARAARRYAAIIEGLESGALSPTTVRLLARYLTAENHGEILAAASGKGKQAVEELLACLFPEADVVARVRKVPAPQTTRSDDVSRTQTSVVACAPVACSPITVGSVDMPNDRAASPVVPPARAVVRPLAPERYEIRFTASGEMREKLRVALDLLGHAIPGATSPKSSTGRLPCWWPTCRAASSPRPAGRARAVANRRNPATFRPR